ncbi:CopD family protein [Xenophilus arseniciresistens]|uniref:Protoporphyrinogen IX oxidase n=1 Tax=Xenophilus arseniciresistens TaxID=1283306 RepID=A0AAE3N3B4_9BURK|nr:CopD family protein [Xenophilus arseniciresistens]MDA7415020.1 CopD family protein [Xenophilus arseniciresistens]
MPWLKLLHICAVILWCGALLYLPLAVAAAGGAQRRPVALGAADDEILRALFVWGATPAALLAIASGTLIFIWHGTLGVWLLAKLALVALLVLGHASFGLLILRLERGQPARHAALGVGALLLPLLLTIAWLVLAQPGARP